MKNKRQNRQGCYLLRESHLNYDEYCLDVCLEEGEQATTFFIEKSAEGCTFKGLGGKTYPSIPELLTNHQEVTKKIPGGFASLTGKLMGNRLSLGQATRWRPFASELNC